MPGAADGRAERFAQPEVAVDVSDPEEEQRLVDGVRFFELGESLMNPGEARVLAPGYLRRCLAGCFFGVGTGEVENAPCPLRAKKRMTVAMMSVSANAFSIASSVSLG